MIFLYKGIFQGWGVKFSKVFKGWGLLIRIGGSDRFRIWGGGGLGKKE